MAVEFVPLRCRGQGSGECCRALRPVGKNRQENCARHPGESRIHLVTSAPQRARPHTLAPPVRDSGPGSVSLESVSADPRKG